MSDGNRRNALKTIAITAPVVWAKPAVDSVILPAHAVISIDCADDVRYESCGDNDCECNARNHLLYCAVINTCPEEKILPPIAPIGCGLLLCSR